MHLNTFSVLFTGDFAPCHRFGQMLLERRQAIFGDLLLDIAAVDLAFVNLETPLCIDGVPIKKSGPNLKAHPDCLKVLADAGFSLVGLANNHIMDFGTEGLHETIMACRKEGLATCGAGNNIFDAQKITFIEKKGLKIAVIAIAEHEFSIAGPNKAGVAPLDPIDNIAQIEISRKDADLVFVTIHGGNEYFPYPRPGLRKFCKFLIDRGADSVICHHQHVAGAYEFYKKKPIVYSLGNLIFDHIKPPDGWNSGYAIRLDYNTLSKKLMSYEIVPYTQSVNIGGVKKIQGIEMIDFLEVLANYGRVLADGANYDKTWVDFCESKASEVLLKLFLPFNFRGLARSSKYLPLINWILPRRSVLARQNLVRCESHHELIMTLLERRC